MMKKLFFFLALLLPIGAWASQIPNAIFDNGIESAIPESTIIPWGTEQAWVMKYVYFDELGNEPGTDGAGHAWTDAEFDDSSWKTLAGPIARYDTDFSVVNTFWEKENSCYYLRRTFNLDEVNKQGYYFCSRHDDNIKVWINGTLVVEAGFNGRCQYHHIPASAFVEGTNTMAIYLDDIGGGAYLDYCMANFYFLKNVETGKFLNAGDEWRAVLADEGLPVRLSKQADGSYTIYFPYGSQHDQLLYRTGERAYVDYNKEWAQTGACPNWTFTYAGEGHMYIQTLTTDPTYGQEAMPGTYLGNNPSSNYVDGYITVGNNITWMVETLSTCTETQTARLQELVTTAKGLGLDTTGEEAVLNNGETTYIDMQETIYGLQDRINDEMSAQSSAIPESTIIPWGTEQAWVMKYVYFDEIGNEPGTDGAGHAWTDAEFDDSSWKTLAGPIARYDTDFSVVNTFWEKENSCYYLRRTFNLDEVNEQGYYFCSHHDDNIKVWINGTQVVEAGWNGRFQYHHIPASAFVKGTNTMAIYLDDIGGGAYLDYCMANFYFLKNVETGKFLNAGDEWRAVLADEGLPVRLSKQADGSYTIYFPFGSQYNQLLYRTGERAYVDYNKEWAQTGACPNWTFTYAGEGHIYIQTLTTNPTYGQEAMPGTYLGNNPSSNYVDGNITVGNNITWKVETLPTRTETQTARLQELVAAAKGLWLDTSGEEDVLNNSETTYLEMLETIYELQNRIYDEQRAIWWAVPDIEKIPAGTKYELDDITLTIGEAGSNDFAVNEWEEPYDETFKNLICGNGENGNKEGGTFYLFTPKKNGDLKVVVRQNVGGQKKFYVEESGRVMDAFNGILPDTDESTYRGSYTIPVFANLTYKVYCAGSKMGLYGFIFKGRDDAEWTNIEFADEKVKALCVANWDTDHNGELSMTEAAAVTDIGEVFKENEEITSFDELRFFTGLTDIPGWNTFNGCHSLTSVTIPASVTSIEGATFANCEALEHISVDPSNTKYCTLQNCNAIIERETNKLVVGCKAAEIPDGVTVIGTEAFHGSTLIQWIGIPESVTELEAGAFAWCISLEGVEIPSSVTKIGDWAFHQTALGSVTLPDNLTTIGENAFKDCNNLNEVRVLNPVPVVLTNAETFSNRANATLNVPKDSRTAYEAAEYWKEFGMIVNVLAEENWDGPYWFSEDGGATYKMTSEGIAINNPKVQEELWIPQTIVIGDLKLKQNHSYKVIVNAKIPSAGQLQLNLFGWDSWNNNISVNASNDFQDLEFLYENYPLDTNNGGVLFQNGGIKGTSVVRSIQVLDVTNGEEVIAEKNWADPYWFDDGGTGATFTITDGGLAITNPKVQDEAWTPQTMILKNANLQKNHTYKVIVNAKIPSDGDLQMQLGSWGSDVYEHQCIAVNASSDFQDLEFIYRDFPADAEDGFVVFQNGFIAGTSIVRSVRILDMGDNPVDLVYSYNEEDHTAEVINNDNGKYKGDVIIPSTVKHNGEDYTVTKINDDAFADCTTLRSITIPETVTELSGWGFRNCASLEQITVVPNNPRFNSNNNCNAIIETGENKLIVGSLGTVIPEGITRIGAHAFWGRWGLETINIPNSVKEIGNHAFSWCFLNEITLPSELEVLEDGAFASTDLQSIILPASLKTIGKEAFNDCPKLTNVTVQNSVPLELDGGETFSNRANATLSLPAGAKKAYKAAPIWKEFKETVEAEHNTVYSYDLTAYLGVPTEMDINLENWDPFTAYQFDIVLPDGITLEKKADGKGIKFTKGKRCAGSRSISVTARDNNTYRVICISTKNEVITGNDGALLTVYLVANENMGMKTCQAEIKNVIMTTPEEKQVNFDPTTVTITTKTLLLGDSNDDEFVNVTDLVATINYILGRPSDKFNKTAADISKNHVVDIFDVNLGLGLIKNGSRGARMMARAAEAANDKMTVRDLSISSGMTKQLQVELTNEASYTGFQFDLVLPEGIKMTSYSTTARIPEDMIVDYNETEGVYRFLGGLGETAISGNSGSIINITVKADENLKGRYLTGYLRDVKLSMATGDGPTIEETPFKITDETSGDLNKNGKLDPADVKAIVELIMTGEYKTKADVNGDSKVDATDIVIVTNEIK